MTNLKTSSPWTPERTRLAKDLWAAGQSAAQIARRLGGVSRCAVLSKMHREKGEGGRAAPSAPRTPAGADPSGRERRDIHRSVVRRRVVLDLWRAPVGAEPASPEAPPQADAAAFAPLTDTRPRPWLDRRRGECAWPVDGSAPDSLQQSCCAPTLPGRTYCPAHRRWARDENQPTTAEMAREAEALVAWLARRSA